MGAPVGEVEDALANRLADELDRQARSWRSKAGIAALFGMSEDVTRYEALHATLTDQADALRSGVRPLGIFLVSRDPAAVGYDEFESVMVAAPDEAAAMAVVPGEDITYRQALEYWRPENLTVQRVGTVEPHIEQPRILIANYRWG